MVEEKEKRNGRMVEVDFNSTTTPSSIATLCFANSQNLKQRGKRLWEVGWKAEEKGRDFHLLASLQTKTIFHVDGGICKGYSVLTIQMRTGKIGDSYFLHTRKVLRFNDRIQL